LGEEQDQQEHAQGRDLKGAALLSTSPTATTLVGRSAEVQRLTALARQALRGQRQIVFITGVPGIG
jgi:hypothetical protein